MSLQPGSRLGRYEIAAPLGAGGMGEVYRGRDTSLDRDVAIKVLPMSTAGLPDARERLSREARALSRLSHPRQIPIAGGAPVTICDGRKA